MKRAVATTILVLSGCGPQTIGELPRPALIVIEQPAGAFCSSTYAVDANNTVWLETGCATSSGLSAQTRTVSTDERAALDVLMDRVLALPSDPACEITTPTDTRYRFVRTLSGTSEWPSTRQCEPALPLDARELVNAFIALAGLAPDGGLDG